MLYYVIIWFLFYIDCFRYIFCCFSISKGGFCVGIVECPYDSHTPQTNSVSVCFCCYHCFYHNYVIVINVYLYLCYNIILSVIYTKRNIIFNSCIWGCNNSISYKYCYKTTIYWYINMDTSTCIQIIIYWITTNIKETIFRNKY